jgi:hypothetical protein
MEPRKTKGLQHETTEVVKVEGAEAMPGDAPLFDRYVVKVDVAISAGAVPTKRPPVGF